MLMGPNKGEKTACPLLPLPGWYGFVHAWGTCQVVSWCLECVTFSKVWSWFKNAQSTFLWCEFPLSIFYEFDFAFFLCSCKRTPEMKSHSTLNLVFWSINLKSRFVTMNLYQFHCLFVCSFVFTYTSGYSAKYHFHFIHVLKNYNFVRTKAKPNTNHQITFQMSICGLVNWRKGPFNPYTSRGRIREPFNFLRVLGREVLLGKR